MGRPARYLVRGLVFVVASAGFLVLASQAVAATLVVDSDGMGTKADCNASTPAFSTIAAGLTAAAAGDTIFVCPGTYPEHLTVAKTVTLQGAQTGVDARTRSGGAETIMDAANGDLLITAPGVVVDGFTFQDQTGGVVQGGAVVSLAGGTQVINDIFRDNIIGFYPNSFQSGSSPPQTLVEHDLFDSNNQPGPASGTGVYSDLGLQNLLVTANLFRNNQNNSVIVDGSGTSRPTGNISISSNVADSGIFLSAVDTATVSGNQIVDPITPGYGLDLFGGVSHATVTGNSFVHGTWGMIFRNDTPTRNSDITLSGNCVAQNSTAGMLVDPGSSSAPIQASGNWWGSTNGASGTGPGFGDAWVDPAGLISSTLFLTAPTPAPCPQLPTISISSPKGILEGNTGTKTLTFPVALSAPYYVKSQFHFATGGGTATPNVDYRTIQGTVTIPAGTTHALVQVKIIGDTIPEPNETFQVTLSDTVNATIKAGIATGTILDDDTLPATGPNGLRKTGAVEGETVGVPVGGVQTGGAAPVSGSRGTIVRLGSAAILVMLLIAGALVAVRTRWLLRTWSLALAAVVGTIFAAAAGVLIFSAAGGLHAADANASAAPGSSSARTDQAQRAGGPLLPASNYVPLANSGMRIQVPSVGVSAHIVDLGLNTDSTLQVPTNPAEAGWWSGGARPGAVGSAVIVGHVDWGGHPAVFSKLGKLTEGQQIFISEGGGKTARYVVDSTAIYPKSQFPTDLVYGPESYAALRLITCTGTFDPATGHYSDNLIVFAHLAGA